MIRPDRWQSAPEGGGHVGIKDAIEIHPADKELTTES